MINIAIVEDNKQEAYLLTKYIKKYSADKNIVFDIKYFENAIMFLSDYRKIYDIIFMDIEMPGLDGMKAAAKLRDMDKQVVLFFVTNMAHYAVKGYEVDALDFMVKPINYHNLSMKMDKALRIINSNKEIELLISNADGLMRISTRELMYVEVLGHKLYYHTAEQTIVATGTLSGLEKRLKEYNFLRCHNCYLVNPKYIQAVNGMIITMRNEQELTISHPRKKKFMTDLADWLGQGNSI